MRCLIILLFASTALPAVAQVQLRWYSKPKYFPEGECVKMHAPSGGEAYVEKVKVEDCRPEKTTYWAKDGVCYEVDAETMGQGFGLKVRDVLKCAPPDALYSFDENKRECWLVDPSGGTQFRSRVDVKECRPPETQIVKKFVPAKGKEGGECLELHATQGSERWEKKVSTTDCRPAETRYAWRKTGELKGDCWELAKAGPEFYSERVGNSQCRPERVAYVFDRMSETRGDCYEVDLETKGDLWAVKVPPRNCQPD
jgi:hypothetical protein